MAVVNRPQTNGHDRSVGDDLRRGREEIQAFRGDLGHLANDARFLVQKEAELARAEVQEAIGKTVRSIIWAGVAVFIANAFLLFAFTAIMLGLDTVLPLWMSALITLGIILVLLMIAGGMAYARMKQVSFKPERTMKSLQEDAEWARTQMRSMAK